jgi:hypothetical protein
MAKVVFLTWAAPGSYAIYISSKVVTSILCIFCSRWYPARISITNFLHHVGYCSFWLKRNIFAPTWIEVYAGFYNDYNDTATLADCTGDKLTKQCNKYVLFFRYDFKRVRSVEATPFPQLNFAGLFPALAHTREILTGLAWAACSHNSHGHSRSRLSAAFSSSTSKLNSFFVARGPKKSR